MAKSHIIIILLGLKSSFCAQEIKISKGKITGEIWNVKFLRDAVLASRHMAKIKIEFRQLANFRNYSFLMTLRKRIREDSRLQHVKILINNSDEPALLEEPARL